MRLGNRRMAATSARGGVDGSGDTARRRRAQQQRAQSRHVAWLTSLLQSGASHHTGAGVSAIVALERRIRNLELGMERCWARSLQGLSSQAEPWVVGNTEEAGEAAEGEEDEVTEQAKKVQKVLSSAEKVAAEKAKLEEGKKAAEKVELNMVEEGKAEVKFVEELKKQDEESKKREELQKQAVEDDKPLTKVTNEEVLQLHARIVEELQKQDEEYKAKSEESRRGAEAGW